MGMSGYILDTYEAAEEAAFNEACEHAWSGEAGASYITKDAGHMWAEDNWVNFLPREHKERLGV